MGFRLIHKWRRALWQMPVIFLAAGALALTVNALRNAPLPLVGDWSGAPKMTTISGERLDIPLDEAARRFREKSAVFIDARSPADFDRGHIPGALNLPWQEADRLFLAATAGLSPNATIIAYCDGESCESSHHLALFLRDMGFNDVKVLVNGWTVWKKAGLPVAFVGRLRQTAPV